MYTKYQDNLERHRTFIATHRNDVDMSSLYNAMEDVFIQIGKGRDDDPVYHLPRAEQVLVENFLEARNNAQLWGKADVDEQGNPKIYAAETGRPIISSDGVIPQIERFATKFVFSRLSVAWMQKVMNAMVAKSEKASGNHFVMVVNTPLWHDVQQVIDLWLKDRRTDGTFLYSKAANDYIKAGATYETYEWAGNTISFKLDRTFDIEFPNRKYGILIDLTADLASGKPAVANFTFKNGEFIQNFINGVGGSTGLSSGEVSSPVAGRKLICHGYSGIAVFNPYRSVILMSHEIEHPWA